MKKLVFTAFIMAVVLSAGCAITNYPVITDSRGANGGGVMYGQYDLAYIVPSGSVGTNWDDGMDELFTEVSQNWMGDQWLKTFNNFDPTGESKFLDQIGGYCDPVRADNCAAVVASNPNYPDDPQDGTPAPAPYYRYDDPFDNTLNADCSGARSVSLFVSVVERMSPVGECGSGLWQDPQALAYEFSQLNKVSLGGKQFYHIPVDSQTTTVSLTTKTKANEVAPIYGRFNLYVDEKLRVLVPVTPNAQYQLRWLDTFAKTNGDVATINATYGTLNASFKVKIRPLDQILDRF